MQLNAIHKATYTEETRYVRVIAPTVRDESLSFAALGLLTFALNQSDGWRIDEEMIKRRGMKRAERRRVIAELESAGYFRRVTGARVKGQFVSIVWDVVECPGETVSTIVEKPHTVNRIRFADDGEPTTASHQRSNDTYKNNPVEEIPSTNHPSDESPHHESSLYEVGEAERDLIATYSAHFGYCNGQTPSVVTELRRLGIMPARRVLDRCKSSETAQKTGVTWHYALKALESEATGTLPPGSAAPPSLLAEDDGKRYVSGAAAEFINRGFPTS